LHLKSLTYISFIYSLHYQPMRHISITSIVIISILLLSFNYKGVPHHKFKEDHFSNVEVKEPSDIVYDAATNHFFIVNDGGTFSECDLTGKVIRTAKEKGWDFEAIEIKDDYIYIGDESARKVHKYKKSDLSLVTSYETPYSGPRNSGFESLTYNETKHCFVMVIEKNPVTLYEMDENFKTIKTMPFKGVKDISAARWYNGFMYLLSDEDMEILKCDPNTYEVLEEYSIKVLNPEGIAFDKDGNVVITSDKLQRIYYYKNLPKTNE